MMSKSLFRVSMVAFCAILMSGFVTSCKDSKNTPDDPETPQERKAVAARAQALAVISSDMLKYYDVTVDYYNNSGELKQLKLETEEFQLETKAPLPTKAGMRMTMKAKEGVDLDNMTESIALTYSFEYKCFAVDANDDIVGEKHELSHAGINDHLQGKKAYVWVNAFNEKLPVSFLYEFDAEGNSKSIDW